MIQTATFVSSLVQLEKLPKNRLPEYAFIGRSNVGKSSLINMLCNIRKLAKVSGVPGKTQTINHFLINNSWYLVDLPGYGYAKTAKSLRKKWSGFTYDYLKKRKTLECTFVLVDARLEPQKNDLEFMQWLGENEIPFAIVFTKIDKLGKIQVQKNLAYYKKELKKTWENLPEIFLTSAEKQNGKEELIHYIEEINNILATQ